MAHRPTELIQEFKTSHTLQRALWIYMGVTVLVFTVLLAAFINQIVDENNAQWQHDAEVTLQQTKTLNDSSIRSISDYIQQRMDSYDVRSLIYNAEYTTYQAIRSRDIYLQLTSVSGMVWNIQLINFNTRTVLDNNGRYSFDVYGDQGILTILDSITPSQHTRIYYQPRSMNTAATTIVPLERNVISLIFYLNKAGAVVVNLDYNLYKSALLPDSSGNPTDYYLFNNEGLFFCGTDQMQFAASMKDMKLYQQVMAQEEDRGSFPYSDSRGRFVVTYIKNDSRGANCIAVTRLEGLYIGSPIFWQMIGLAAIFLVVSIFLSLALALLTSNPIRKLHKSVRELLPEDMPADDQRIDEITFLQNAYQNIVESNRSLAEKSELYQRERESQMLLKLMNPDSSSISASAAAVSELETQLSRPVYRVIALMPDRRKIQMENDAQTIRHGLAAIGGEILQQLGAVRAVFPPSFQVLFLLNSEELDKPTVRETLSRILPACRNALDGMMLYMGVGEAVSSLDEVFVSYSGAVEAVQYAFVRQLNDMVFSGELVFPDLNQQTYVFELDAQITKAIRHMEKDAAEEAVRGFFDQISRYNHNQFVRSILHLDVAFQRLENTLQIEPPSMSSRIDTSTIMRWNAEDACQYFLQRALQDIAQLTDLKKSSSSGNELITQIDQMIDNNIFNPDFSIAQLADELSFSVNYLRSLYKAGAGESLSARITRKRVEAACSLLDNTDESIESITMKLGFSTRNYFFTFFKKHMGMTPAQYRNR